MPDGAPSAELKTAGMALRTRRCAESAITIPPSMSVDRPITDATEAINGGPPSPSDEL